MDRSTDGTVLSVSTQWWIRINRSVVRIGPQGSSSHPHIIKVRYTADGVEYTRRKWIAAGAPVPPVGSRVTVLYRSDKPSRAKIL